MLMRHTLAAVTLSALALGLGCTDAALLAEVQALGEGCLLDSDCATDLVCVFRTCHYQCVETKDCRGKPGVPEGVLCVRGEKPTNVCQLAGEVDCTVDPDCPGDQSCAVDAHCRDVCTFSAQCVSPQACSGRSCAEEEELIDGVLTGAGPGAAGEPCDYTSDCEEALVCRGGVCAVECKASVDCAYGFVCDDSHCVPEGGTGEGGGDAGAGGSGHGGSGEGGELPAGYGSPCDLQSDCEPYDLLCGLGGTCVYECNGDVDCPIEGSCCAEHTCRIGIVCEGNGGAGDGGASGNTVGPGGGGGTVGDICSTNLDCDDGFWCNGLEDCVSGYCRNAADGPCDSNSACVVDSCSEPAAGEVAGDCDHEILDAEEDEDEDGHLALACVGGTDCDDQDETINPEAVELCDDTDNNCNGLIDDHAVSPLGQPVTNTVTRPFGATTPFITPWTATGDHLLAEVADDGIVWLGTVDDEGDTVIPSASTGLDLLYYDSDELLVEHGPSHSLVAGVGTSFDVQVSVADASGGSITTTPAADIEYTAGASWFAAAAWAGSSYVFAYRIASQAHYAEISPAGALTSPIIDVASGLGGPVAPNDLAVAANDGTVLIAYSNVSQTAIEATVVRPNGGNPYPAGTITIPTGDSVILFIDLHLVPLGDGFVFAGGRTGVPMTVVYFEVTAQNQVVAVENVPLPDIFGSPSLATDGSGIALALDDSQDGDLYYWRPGHANPVELSSSLFGPQGGACNVEVRGIAGQLVASCPQANAGTLPWRRLGCR